MKLENYEFDGSPSHLDYEFESVGPKGTIKKVVRFSPSRIWSNVYNMGFGDLDEETGEIDDRKVTNNGDTDKVLATVAQIAYKFTSIFKGAAIFFKGSTPARTRLYQMKMNEHWGTIDPLFEVQGSREKRWELFQRGVNYDAFLARRHPGAFFYYQQDVKYVV